jgi:hypothetical protein
MSLWNALSLQKPEPHTIGLRPSSSSSSGMERAGRREDEEQVEVLNAAADIDPTSASASAPLDISLLVSNVYPCTEHSILSAYEAERGSQRVRGF